MEAFAKQVRHNCHRCGVPLRRYGQLAVGGEYEEVSAVHADIYRSKILGRPVNLVEQLVELDEQSKVDRVTNYIPNCQAISSKPKAIGV